MGHPSCGFYSSLALDRRGFPRNEYRGRWGDSELFRIIAFVVGDADSSPRINVQKRVSHWDIHKGFDVRNADRFFVNLQVHFVAEGVSKFLELVSGNVRNERPVGIVEADNV